MTGLSDGFMRAYERRVPLARSRRRSDKVLFNFLSTIPAVMALVTGVLGTARC